MESQHKRKRSASHCVHFNTTNKRATKIQDVQFSLKSTQNLHVQPKHSLFKYREQHSLLNTSDIRWPLKRSGLDPRSAASVSSDWVRPPSLGTDELSSSDLTQSQRRPVNDCCGPHRSLNVHQATAVTWPTGSGNHDSVSSSYPDSRERICRNVASSSFTDTRCDAREIINKGKRSREHSYLMAVDPPRKRQKHNHLSDSETDLQRCQNAEKSEMDILLLAVKSKRAINSKTTEEILKLLNARSDIQYELLVTFVQALGNGDIKKHSEQLFKSCAFWHHISVLLCSMPQEKCKDKRNTFLKIIEGVTVLFKKLLEARPFVAFKHLPIDSCSGAVEQLSQQDYIFRSVEEKVAQLKSKRDEIRQGLFNVEEHKSVQDDLALPTREELHCSSIPTVVLRENIVKGPFTSNFDYISIFYSLVREDFLHPLREAMGKVGQNKQFLYKNVRCSVIESCGEEVKCRLSFTTKKKVSWQYSKKLMYGSLLCLSHDSFASLFFATVSERDIDDLKNCSIVVTLIGLAAKDARYVSPSKVYQMFESPCYYEAYAPIIRTLHSLREDPSHLPFGDYLVRCKVNVQKPKYLEQNPAAKYNLRNVICSCKPLECQHDCFSIDDIENEDLNNPSFVALDPSQSKALCAALTRELVLIQGPPGTGKTYVGLKIVQSFLINKKLWNVSSRKPILIVCYTNHALDQFLEGLVKIKDTLETTLQIRRVGGRSKSTILEPYNIKIFINRMKRQEGVSFNSKDFLRKMESRINHLSEFLKGTLPSSKEAITAYSLFLSSAILDEFKQYIYHFPKLGLPAFPELVCKAIEENPFHDRIESERQFSFDDNLFSDSKLLFEEKSLKNFVSYFHETIHPLSHADKILETLEEDSALDGYVHLQLFKHCLAKLLVEWRKELAHAAEENAQSDKQVEMIRVRCLQDADVVGLTINGAAKLNAALTQVKSKICIIEEAGEVMEPHVITSVTQHTQQLILIGDHKQLRPKTNCDVIGRNYKLNISLFERLVNNNFPVVTLKIQHRMRPEIACLVSNHVYDGYIENSDSVHGYDNVKGMSHNLFFLNHCEYETRDDDEHSPFNTHEAQFVVQLCKYLILCGHKSENITVITPYLGQLREIKEHSKNGCVHVKVSTVDNFQGEEDDIVLLSLVRSNKEEEIGFTRFKNRVCVAMSRAKKGFYCIGNFSTFIKKSKLWQSISIDLKKDKLISDKLPVQCITHGNVTLVSNAADIEKVLLEGCGQRCQIRLPACNHACNRFCHPDDQAHQKNCTEPCPKRCDKGLHRCIAKCGVPCPLCKQPMEKTIPKCGHKHKIPCDIPETEFLCTNDCKKTLICGHPCKLMCGQKCSSIPCKFLVTKTWGCGHSAQRECHESELDYSLVCNFPCDEILVCGHKCSGKCGKCRQGRLHVPCKEKCTRILFCGHPCSDPCARNCKPCTEICKFKCSHGLCNHKCSKKCKPCPHRCNWMCEHFQCTMNCGEQCDRERCLKPCMKRLKCKHTCIGLCGEACPSVCRVCNKNSEAFDILFGEEDNPDSRFIQLNDCKHVIEAKGMDEWIDSVSDDQNDSIKWKTCPKCNSPVISTLRYANQAKKVLVDMNKIKHRESYFLSKSDRNECHKNARELCHLANDMLKKSYTGSTRTTDIGQALTKKFITRIQQFQQVNDLQNDFLLNNFLIFFQSLHYALSTLHNIADIFSSKTMEQHVIKTSGIKWLCFQAKDFLKWLLECLSRNHFTDQVQKDSSAESRRMFLLGQLYYLTYRSMKFQNVKLSESETATLRTYDKYECFGSCLSVSIDECFEKVSPALQLIAKRFGQPLNTTERNTIIKALGAKAGSWYKCPNGHIYQIGECGGAMEQSKCPECSEVIGGRSHSLASGNQHAGEFDDSAHAAWSEGANLANYEGF